MPTPESLIQQQLVRRGIRDAAVLDAMRRIDRARFVPDDLAGRAYDDSPLPIGYGQTISQPYIVAHMAEALQLGPNDTVLEVGSGCGYHAAVVAQLVRWVYSVEIVAELAAAAAHNLERAGTTNVTVRAGDGYRGWPEQAPFDAIYLTAAPTQIPQPLKDQLKVGGRLLAPVGSASQRLVMLTKQSGTAFSTKDLALVSFVPMTGAAERDQ